MEKNFLVTFEINGKTDYYWLDTIEELQKEVENLRSKGAIILDAIQILGMKEIDV